MNNTRNSNLDSQPYQLIRIKTVIVLTALSKSYIYQLVSKGKFPKPINLVPGGSSVAWIEQEVLGWIDSRIQERDNGAA
jgi:prophage regulatory protein